MSKYAPWHKIPMEITQLGNVSSSVPLDQSTLSQTILRWDALKYVLLIQIIMPNRLAEDVCTFAFSPIPLFREVSQITQPECVPRPALQLLTTSRITQLDAVFSTALEPSAVCSLLLITRHEDVWMCAPLHQISLEIFLLCVAFHYVQQAKKLTLITTQDVV